MFLCVCIHVCLFCFCRSIGAIGEVGELIANLDRFTSDFGRRMYLTNQFMQYRNIPPTVQKRVNTYLAHIWTARRGIDPHEALATLPNGLRFEIMSYLCEDLLANVPLFRHQMLTDGAFRRHIIDKLTFESYPQNEYIFRRGEIGDCMYLISEGEVGIVLDEKVSEVPVKIIGIGSFFGEAALINDSTRGASIRALTSCYLLVLSKTDFFDLLETHPKFAEEIRLLSATRDER